jgi:hypothetical protein
MFNINWTSYDEMFEETQKNLRDIDGIDSFYAIVKELYNSQYLTWGDDNIDELAYYPKEGTLTVRVCSNLSGLTYKGNKAKYAFFMIDFFDVEISYFDIAPEHYIDDVFIQKNSDGRYSISFGSGELNFSYSRAKVNRSWIECENYK